MGEPDGSQANWSTHPHNPYTWSAEKKWSTMVVACLVTFIAGLNATSITTASEAISEEFNLSSNPIETNFFAVTAWNAAAAFVPLVTLPLMDTYGVRYGYLVRSTRRRRTSISIYKPENGHANYALTDLQAAYVIFVIFLIPQALAKNFATLVACRFFAGAMGGTLQNAADGIAANLFLHQHQRVLPLTGYAFSLLAGVTMGPVLGAVVEPLQWRWYVYSLQSLFVLCFAAADTFQGSSISKSSYPLRSCRWWYITYEKRAVPCCRISTCPTASNRQCLETVAPPSTSYGLR